MGSKKSILLYIGFSLLAAVGWSQNVPADSGHQYSIADLKEDFHYFKSHFEKSDPSLYLYTPKEVFDKFCDSLSASMVGPLSAREFYNLITLLNTKLMNGHVHIFPHSDSADNQNLHGVFLPLHLRIIGEKLYADMITTSERVFPEGTEITSINGQRTADIIHFMMTRQIRDGYNETYPRWILNNWFKEYYGFHFGYPARFEIGYKAPDGSLQMAGVRALPKDSIRFYQKKYYPAWKYFLEGEGISLRFDAPTQTAVLKIRTFDIEMLKETYHLEFGKVISSFFRQIQEQKSKNLIIDLRDNQGGDVENGSLLISHLLDTAFHILRNYYKVKDAGSGNFDTRNVVTGGPALGQQQPAVHPFSGRLIVLVNGGSFSNSGIVSSALASYKRALFIGEETGGNDHIIGGDADNDVLPHTRIEFEVPTKIYEFRERKSNRGHGTMPDYEVAPNIEDIISQKDPVMNKAMELLRKKQ